jgi:hypothetical protein
LFISAGTFLWNVFVVRLLIQLLTGHGISALSTAKIMVTKKTRIKNANRYDNNKGIANYLAFDCPPEGEIGSNV